MKSIIILTKQLVSNSAITVALLLIVIPTVTFSQLSSDEYYNRSKYVIDSLERKYNSLKANNRRLSNKVKNMKNTERQLADALSKLYINNIELRKMESKIRELNQNYSALGSENQELLLEIKDLEKRLVELNKIYSIIEKQHAKQLEKNNHFEALFLAQERAFSYLLETKNESKFPKLLEASISAGGGEAYSGFGTSAEIKYGRNFSIGGKIGFGYLPNTYGIEAVSMNFGLNIYLLKDLYLNGTFHLPIYRISEFFYRDAYTYSIGYNYYFNEKGLTGLKISVGGLYTDGEIKSEHAFIGGFGFIYRF